jgi:DNA repair protein RecN (Recombination protein N)
VALAPDYDIDTTPLRQYKEKMSAIQKLSDEIKVPIEDMPHYARELMTNVERIRNCNARLRELEDLIKQSEDEYRKHARVLTEKRIAAGETMSQAINALLPPLKLLRAEFKVQVNERNAREEWTERGFNTITFTARMNPGQPFSSITDTASGGELARLVLAVKVVLQRIQSIPTLIFDEVDTGIGGSAAAAVGEKLAQLAEATQVMTITHSPQVAARGEQHLHVSKKTDGVVTTSIVRTLSLNDRIDEIARMLSGDQITSEALAAAKKLIEEAALASESRHRRKA